MSLLQKWLVSVSMILGQRIVLMIIAAMAQLIIIPFLTIAEFGEFILFFAIAQLISPFFHWGVSQSITKLVPQYLNDPASTASILKYHGLLLLILCILTGIFLFTLSFLFTNIIGTENFKMVGASSIQAILMVILLALAIAAEVVMYQTLLALDRVFFAVIINGGLRNIFFLCCVGLILLTGKLDYNIILWFQIAASSFALLISISVFVSLWINLKKSKKSVNSQVDLFENNWREIMALSLSMMGATLITQVRLALEPILVQLFFGLDMTGLVGAARRIANLANQVANSMGMILGPYSVRYNNDSDKEALQMLHTIVAFLTMLGCFIGVILIYFVGKSILTELFGSQYAEASLFIQIMLFFLGIRYMFGFPNYVLLVRGGERSVFYSYLYDLIVTLPVFFILGSMGYIYMAIAAAALIQVLQFAWLWHITNKQFLLRTDAFSISLFLILRHQ